MLVDNPFLSNCEVARRVGVSELSIRYWKKQPFWEVEKQKILSDRIEEQKRMIEANPQKYIEDLEKEQEDAKKIRDGIKSLAVQYIKISSTALSDAMTTDTGVKASKKAFQSGVNRHSDSAIKIAEAIARLNEQIYQIGIVASHIEGLKEQEEHP